MKQPNEAQSRNQQPKHTLEDDWRHAATLEDDWRRAEGEGAGSQMPKEEQREETKQARCTVDMKG